MHWQDSHWELLRCLVNARCTLSLHIKQVRTLISDATHWIAQQTRQLTTVITVHCLLEQATASVCQPPISGVQSQVTSHSCSAACAADTVGVYFGGEGNEPSATGHRTDAVANEPQATDCVIRQHDFAAVKELHMVATAAMCEALS